MQAKAELRNSKFVENHVGMLGKMHEQITWTGQLPDFVTMPQIEAPQNFNPTSSNTVAEQVMPVLTGLFPFIPSSTIKSVVDESTSLENDKRQSQRISPTLMARDSNNLSPGASVGDVLPPVESEEPATQPSRSDSGDISTVGPSVINSQPSFLSPSNGNCTTSCN